MNRREDWIENLKSPNPQLRYEAVCALARWPVHDEFFETSNAVWALTEDTDRRIRWAAGIASSMMTARNAPGGIMFGGPVPDFLTTWDELNAGVTKEPTLDDWDLLRRMQDDLGLE